MTGDGVPIHCTLYVTSTILPLGSLETNQTALQETAHCPRSASTTSALSATNPKAHNRSWEWRHSIACARVCVLLFTRRQRGTGLRASQYSTRRW
jgi:hypothetical protein